MRVVVIQHYCTVLHTHTPSFIEYAKRTSYYFLRIIPNNNGELKNCSENARRSIQKHTLLTREGKREKTVRWREEKKEKSKIKPPVLCYQERKQKEMCRKKMMLELLDEEIYSSTASQRHGKPKSGRKKRARGK